MERELTRHLPNKVNIAKWIMALRSGKYEQGRKMLKTLDDEMCCLGVACDVSELGKWEVIVDNVSWNDTRALNYYKVSGPGNMSAFVLPDSVADWLGTMNNPYLKDNYGDSPLTSATANDELGKSFSEIADMAEEYYLEGKTAEEVLNDKA